MYPRAERWMPETTEFYPRRLIRWPQQLVAPPVGSLRVAVMGQNQAFAVRMRLLGTRLAVP
jgi:hypothetical protein